MSQHFCISASPSLADVATLPYFQDFLHGMSRHWKFAEVMLRHWPIPCAMLIFTPFSTEFCLFPLSFFKTTNLGKSSIILHQIELLNQKYS